MRPFNIVLVQPAGYAHSQAFAEIAKLLLCSFRSLGIECKLQVNAFDLSAINIILGYNVISDPSAIPACDFVIYQLEQLFERDGWFQPAHLAMYHRAREVWDYAQENIDFLGAKGIHNTRLLPIGFHEELRAIPSATRDIDVLFYGSLNNRRRTVLEELAKRCKLTTLFGVYGDARDGWIARSKVILNLHYYDTQIIEQPRVSYLLNNKRFVLSEESTVNPYGPGLVTAPYGQLIQACLSWLDRPADRDAMAEAGFEHFKSRPMTGFLGPVLRAFI
ncbi:MAG TPA: hypothetical protein VE988_15590 [Gemmataceae bacterium]|nr:hypothetical protein [Gemmataceae bacterium]